MQLTERSGLECADLPLPSVTRSAEQAQTKGCDLLIKIMDFIFVDGLNDNDIKRQMKNEKIRDKMRDERYTCSCCFHPSKKRTDLNG